MGLVGSGIERGYSAYGRAEADGYSLGPPLAGWLGGFVFQARCCGGPLFLFSRGQRRSQSQPFPLGFRSSCLFFARASLPLRSSGAEAWPSRRAKRSGQLLARTRVCREEGWRDGGEMNTVLTRANSLFAFSLSVMAALTFGCFITTAFKERSVPVSIAVSRVMLKNVEDFTGPGERSDLGIITFDISADLQSIFDWNVKQLFLYLSAEYSTKNNALNQVVLWDKIILRGDNPKLLLKDLKSKYFFFDDGNGLKGNRNVTLTLSWNVVPNAGILPLVTGAGHISVPFPDTYKTAKSY